VAKPRALIVDDDEPIRVMLAAIVRQSGFAVETARDGQEAIERLKKGTFQVILLDLMMPRVNGYDVLQHIRTHHPDLLARTIVATAVPERELQRDLTTPVFKVHMKPFDVPQLMADIRSCVKEKT
jgi:CheY-like chemotaxis protein